MYMYVMAQKLFKIAPGQIYLLVTMKALRLIKIIQCMLANVKF